MSEKAAAKALEMANLEKKLRRELFEREEALDKLTLQKIKDKWFDALLDIRVPEMQDNLRHILYYMETLIEAQNFRQLLFEDERHDLEEMNAKQGRGQSSALQELTDIYEMRLRDMKATYDEKVKNMKNEADEEFAALENREKQTQENMQAMLFQMEKNKARKEDQMNGDMFLKIDDERSKNTEKLENMRTTLETKMEKRWEEITTTLSTYDADTKERRQHYTVLKAKDDTDSKIIHDQMKKTQKLFEQIEDLKKRLDSSYATGNAFTLIDDLRDERTKFFEAFNYLKEVLGEEMRNDKNRLKLLTGVSNATTRNLKNVCSTGEKILTLFRICKKLETEDEKVVPVGESLHLIKPTPEVNEKKHGSQHQQLLIQQHPHHHQQQHHHHPSEERTREQNLNLSDLITKDVEVLKKLWRKSADARLKTLALKKYTKRLEMENARLKNFLTSYLKQAVGKVNPGK